jgi:hypothetical protein
MFHKSILGALAAAAAAAAVLAVLQLKNRDEKEEEEKSDDDDEIHFIEIRDEPDEAEKPHEVHVEEVKMDEGEDEEEDKVNIETFHEKPAESEETEEPEEAEESAEPEESEKPEEAEEAEVPQEVKEIAELYPYLDLDFIQRVLAEDVAYKDRFADEPLITIRHSAVFKDDESALKFVKVMEDAGYQCEKKDLDVTAEVREFCEDGTIISDELNVANQVKALDGEYKGIEVSE